MQCSIFGQCFVRRMCPEQNNGYLLRPLVILISVDLQYKTMCVRLCYTIVKSIMLPPETKYFVYCLKHNLLTEIIILKVSFSIYDKSLLLFE